MGKGKDTLNQLWENGITELILGSLFLEYTCPVVIDSLTSVYYFISRLIYLLFNSY